MKETDHSKPSVRFITLGCKVNQYETQGMREALTRAGYRMTAGEDDECQVVIINTCTVTHQADKENRYWIRRARREHPSAKIVVTGCYVERNRAELEALAGVDLILSNQAKGEIATYLTLLSCSSPEMQDREGHKSKGFDLPRSEYLPLSISKTEGRGRAYLKIQDGCNHACSFCKVVLVRGRSRSRDLAAVRDEALRLRDSGYREIVLTGIQLGAYGLDLGGGVSLVDALRACAAIEGIERVRLSSIEPIDVTEELIEALATLPEACPHLHIPLQSGDDGVLKRMNRRYTSDFYLRLIQKLKDRMPNFSLTLDVMAGFPGEGEKEFANTCRVLEEVKPLKCHVFPYSRREGTRAARFPSCESTVIRRRVQELIALGEKLAATEKRRYLGKTVAVLVEKKMERGGLLQGLTSNYLKVVFQGPEDWVGRQVNVHLDYLQGDVFLGRSWT